MTNTAEVNDLEEPRPPAREKSKELAEKFFLEKGKWPRVEQIRRQLGYGSNTSIGQGLEDWAGEHWERYQKLTSRPEISDALMKKFIGLMDSAYEEADKNYTVERLNQKQELATLQKKLDVVQENSDEHFKTLERNQVTTDQLKGELKEAIETNNQLRQQETAAAANFTATIESLRTTIAKLEKLNSEKDLQVAQLTQQHQDNLEKEQARFDAMERLLVERSTKAEADQRKAETLLDKAQTKMSDMVASHANQLQALFERHQQALLDQQKQGDQQLAALRDTLVHDQYAHAAAIAERENKEQALRQSMDVYESRITELSEKLMSIKDMPYLPACEITDAQRAQAKKSPLYKLGDMKLVWMNESYLDQELWSNLTKLG